MVIDPVSNLINGLKTASLRKIDTITIPYSELKMNVLELLKKEGYVEDISKKGKKIKKSIDVTLKYDDEGPVIHDVKRVSKFSRRVYKGFKEIYPVKNGYGLMILSTPQGILTDKQARKEKVGGEVLFEIW